MSVMVRGYRDTLLAAVLLVLTAFVVYYPVLGNFFSWDDFLWIYRAKTLSKEPLQVFSIDAVYFDPLVYLWFWIDFQLHGLNYFWYHVSDASLHACNGFLIYLLMRKLAADNFAAIAGSLLFLTSFASVDAVAWSSSRVDLLAVFFSLLTTLLYIHYVESGRSPTCLAATAAFILALASKGTPLLLPVVLFLILIRRGELSEHWRTLLPFLAVILTYLVLLAWRLSASGKPFFGGAGNGVNIRNLALSFAELFVPERYLSSLNVGWVTAAVLLFFCLAGYYLPRSFAEPVLFGLVLTVVGLLPVLILKDFKLVTSINNAGHLLNSPSHRIYLASAGVACCGGVLLAVLSRRSGSIWIGGILLLLISSFSIYEVRAREELWKDSAAYIRRSVEGIALYRPQLLENSAIGLVNFPMSRGFIRPALSLYCGLEQVLFLPMAYIPAEILDAPEIFRYRNRAFFFVYGGDTVINLTDSFCRILDLAFFYQVSQNPRERSMFLAEYQSLVAGINKIIAETLKSSDFEPAAQG